MELALLLLGVAATASVCGYAGSALSRRRQRGKRGIFLIGFLCGTLAVSLFSRAQRIGGLVSAGPRRSALVFDEVRRHLPYSGTSRSAAPGSQPRRAQNRMMVRR